MRIADLSLDASGNVSVTLGVPERGESTKTGVRQGVVADYDKTKDFLRGRKEGREESEKLFSLSIPQYTRAWRKSLGRLGLTYVGPPHSVRHSGPSRDALLGYRKLDEIQKRGRWVNVKSAHRYSKSHTYIAVCAMEPAWVRERAVDLWKAWGSRPEVAVQ